jgi:hypothetical protein
LLWHELSDQRAVGIQPLEVDFPALDCGRDRAARLAQMSAVVELAIPDERPKFDEAVLEVLRRHMVEPEFLQARRVDEVACCIEVIELCVRRGVASAAERLGQFRNARRGIRQQAVDDGRFSHSRLADEHADVAGETRTQRCNVELRRERQYAIAERAIWLKRSQRRRTRGQVHFVESDHCVYLPCSAATVQRSSNSGWTGAGEHDHDLRRWP